MLPSSTFVLGGAASGKSAWAEALVESAAMPMVYLATSEVLDGEVADKVARHRERRGNGWRTIEEPLNLGPALAAIGTQEVVLIDCATMWLSNHLLAESDMPARQEELLDALRQCRAPWVIVSNEVGHGVVPDNALARRFREAQGRLNIALAAQAELAVQVVAGLPQVLKGRLP